MSTANSISKCLILVTAAALALFYHLPRSTSVYPSNLNLLKVKLTSTILLDVDIRFRSLECSNYKQLQKIDDNLLRPVLNIDLLFSCISNLRTVKALLVPGETQIISALFVRRQLVTSDKHKL